MDQTADYVIVGAGSAGCVLARRLADAGASVIMLEAGGPDRSYIVRKPGMIAIFHNVPDLKKRLDWGYFSAPQASALGRTIPQVRGRVVGGSGSINGMLFVRGNARNYDDWAADGCAGWGHSDVLASFKRMENWEDGATELRGAGGPIEVTRQVDLTPASQAFMAALAETAGVPVIDDYNGASQEGVAVFQQSVRGGLRYSSSVGYLDHHNLPNLAVETRITVARIIVDKGRATGVEVITADGKKTINATREVILSAGVYGSPQILMLSGIGPAAHLREHGLDVVADLPVGDNLHDHMFVPMTYVMKSARNRGTTPYFASGLVKETLRGGTWMGRSVFEAVGFVRSQQAGTIPDIQVHALPWSYPFPNQDAPVRHKVDKRSALTIMPTLIYPKSRGTVRLASTDPSAGAGDRPCVPVRPRRRRTPARRDGTDSRGHVQPGHRRRDQPRAIPRYRLPRSPRAREGTPQSGDDRLPPGRHLPHGSRRAGGRRPVASGTRHRRAPRRRRVDHAEHHGRQHQRSRDDDRRARRGDHARHGGRSH